MINTLTVIRNRPLMTLMLGHFTVDSYVGVIPILYPLLIDRFALNLKTVGLVTLAYVGMASLAQPLFGWLADRYGTRLIGLALAWTAIMFALVGFASSFPLLLLAAGAAGLGSGAYHPFGALSASRVIAERQRNTAMSIYVTGGTLGVAVGPLMGVIIFSIFGMSGTALLMVPGALVAAWMLRELREFNSIAPAKHHVAEVGAGRIALRPLLAAVGTMMASNWALYSIETFVPTWYESMGYAPSFYGALATTVLLSSAVGAVASGALADRYGIRMVTIGSQLLCIPSILLFTQFTGPIAFLSAMLVGLSMAAVSPLMLVTAQKLLAGRAGMASGMILGLGFITAAVGVPITGALADAIGLQGALRAQTLVLVVAVLLATLLPNE